MKFIECIRFHWTVHCAGRMLVSMNSFFCSALSMALMMFNTIIEGPLFHHCIFLTRMSLSKGNQLLWFTLEMLHPPFTISFKYMSAWATEFCQLSFSLLYCVQFILKILFLSKCCVLLISLNCTPPVNAYSIVCLCFSLFGTASTKSSTECWSCTDQRVLMKALFQQPIWRLSMSHLYLF